jgi:hypothetical protein
MLLDLSDTLIQGNDSVRQLVATEHEKSALTIVSPYARAAIHKEILPQVEGGANSKSDIQELHEHMVKGIETAFRTKSPIYTGLIKYKSIDQSDDQFQTDLILVLDEWKVKTEKLLLAGEDEDKDTDDGQGVKVKLEVDSDTGVKVNLEVDSKSSGGKAKDKENAAIRFDSEEDQGLPALESGEIEFEKSEIKESHQEDAVPTVELPFDLLDMVM